MSAALTLLFSGKSFAVTSRFRYARESSFIYVIFKISCFTRDTSSLCSFAINIANIKRTRRCSTRVPRKIIDSRLLSREYADLIESCIRLRQISTNFSKRFGNSRIKSYRSVSVLDFVLNNEIREVVVQ